MLDVRRYTDYDANDTVSQYLNLPPVKVTCRPSLFNADDGMCNAF